MRKPEEMARHETCPVCSGPRLKDCFRSNGYTLSRCRSCTTMFVRERPTGEDLAEFYLGSPADQVYEDADNEPNLQRYYLDLKSWLEEGGEESGRLLDIGCSAGQFLDVMTGWDRHGIEIHTGSVDRARSKYGGRIHRGTLEDYPVEREGFDLVTLLDVFDHVRDPIDTLERAYRLLNPGGRLVIKVHDISCLYARVTGSHFYAISPPGHLFYFSLRSLRAALTRAGFVLVGSRHIGHTMFLKTILYRLSKGNRDRMSYRLYEILDGRRIGNLRVRKNLFDIITVIAVKPGGESPIAGIIGS